MSLLARCDWLDDDEAQCELALDHDGPHSFYDSAPADAPDVARLIREAVYVADYGLGRDGCPFCSGVRGHNAGCIAVAFGATGKDPDP